MPEYAPGYGASRGTYVFTLRRLVEAGDVDGIRHVAEVRSHVYLFEFERDGTAAEALAQI